MPGAAIKPFIMSQTIPWCPKCRRERDIEIESIKKYRALLKKHKAKGKKVAEWDDDDDDDDDIPAWAGEPGIIKPDITFFGQALDSEFDESLFKDREQVDLLVIMGTSLKVAPVSEVLCELA
jgi:NAD-dependent histone deacetylase SIR2